MSTYTDDQLIARSARNKKVIEASIQPVVDNVVSCSD